MMLTIAASEARVENLIIGLLIVGLIAAAVYFICRAVHRPDLGGIGAALVAIIGGLLVLLQFM